MRLRPYLVFLTVTVLIVLAAIGADGPIGPH
jgi:hypothetical protein